MGVSIVFGGQFGSEGKGKTTLYFAQKFGASAVVRVGGTNSGHTIVDSYGQRKAFRILPVASVLQGVSCVLPAGSYIDLEVLEKEIKESGLQKENLKIHPNAVIIQEEYAKSESEDRLNARIGSTESGTGRAVMARVARDKTAITLAKDEERLKPYVCDTTEYLREELKKNHEVIIEGTQGFGLSLLHAKDYPYVTSRDTSAAAFLSEAGLSPRDVTNVIMTIRAFPIRVAGESGSLPNEISWDDVTSIAKSGTKIEEYTTVTNRCRRVARFDSDVVKRSICSNQPNIIVLNHCDYFDYSINNAANISKEAEAGITEIEGLIGKVDYVGTGDRTLIDR